MSLLQLTARKTNNKRRSYYQCNRAEKQPTACFILHIDMTWKEALINNATELKSSWQHASYCTLIWAGRKLLLPMQQSWKAADSMLHIAHWYDLEGSSYYQCNRAEKQQTACFIHWYDLEGSSQEVCGFVLWPKLHRSENSWMMLFGGKIYLELILIVYKGRIF